MSTPINIRESFPKTLPSNRIFITKAWINPNSTKDQVTVQWCQNMAGENPASAAISRTQGIKLDSPQTALESYSREVAIRLGFINKGEQEHLFNDDTTLYADDLFPGNQRIGIKVWENTTKNPLSKTQTPVTNPTTGEIKMHGGMPVYRHSSVVDYNSATRNYLVADAVDQPVPAGEGLRKF